MTTPKPKPLGTTIEIPEGARVRRPGASQEITVTGGLYVLDTPGEHMVDGKAITATADATEEAPGA